MEILLHVIFPVVMGSMIYIMFHRESLLVFQWIKIAGLSGPVADLRSFTFPLSRMMPQWIRYSLADGIWVYSGTALLLMIWRGKPKTYLSRLWILLPLVTAVGAEVLQLLCLVQGTFCKTDMLFYGLFFSMSITVFTLNKRRDFICLPR